MLVALLMILFVFCLVSFVSGFFTRGIETLLRFTTAPLTMFVIRLSSYGYSTREYLKSRFFKS